MKSLSGTGRFAVLLVGGLAVFSLAWIVRSPGLAMGLGVLGLGAVGAAVMMLFGLSCTLEQMGKAYQEQSAPKK